ncbi:pantoate--beta-alanine ligase [Corynebacterium stationis]|uniref:pantoate--beta-alanine ligase n=1 Tax=Corynebacterium stationis TaxID=1705 RepID=UPI00263A953A|nr:pantoate--beta-alanine ligase [Corynebacterium stationis]
MSIGRGQATVVTELDMISKVGSAFKKTGAPVVLVPLGHGVHAGHIALVRAAKAIRGAVVVVAVASEDEDDLNVLRKESVDVIWQYTEEKLWPKGQHLRLAAKHDGLEPADELSDALTRNLALIGALAPSDVVVGEKDYELLIALNQAIRDFHIQVRLQGVPTVRMPDGLALSLRNMDVEESLRDKASTLSAALTAGAHAAEAGAEQVLEVVNTVLDAAGIEPEYVELRGLDLGPAPEIGDARLLVAANIGGVRLTDNVGLPLGIGFRNIEAHAEGADNAAGSF